MWYKGFFPMLKEKRKNIIIKLGADKKRCFLK